MLRSVAAKTLTTRKPATAFPMNLHELPCPPNYPPELPELFAFDGTTVRLRTPSERKPLSGWPQGVGWLIAKSDMNPTKVDNLFRCRDMRDDYLSCNILQSLTLRVILLFTWRAKLDFC